MISYYIESVILDCLSESNGSEVIDILSSLAWHYFYSFINFYFMSYIIVIVFFLIFFTSLLNSLIDLECNSDMVVPYCKL